MNATTTSCRCCHRDEREDALVVGLCLECLTYRVCDVCFDLYFGGELIPLPADGSSKCPVCGALTC
jgi:hypothetical protein